LSKKFFNSRNFDLSKDRHYWVALISTSSLVQHQLLKVTIQKNHPEGWYFCTTRHIVNTLCMACPARFERATYALEEFVAVKKANNFNDL